MKKLINSVMFILIMSFASVGAAKDNAYATIFGKQPQNINSGIQHQKPFLLAKGEFCHKDKNSESVRCSSYQE